jgi:hypothetical protein
MKLIKYINRCHIYIRAIFISDITNIQGTLIESWALLGKRPMTRKSAGVWPVQERPTIWIAWKDALEFLAPERMVPPSLGACINAHHQIQEWYYDAED